MARGVVAASPILGRLAGWLALRCSYSACTSLHQLAELTQTDQSIVTVLAEGIQHPRLYGGPEIPQLAACPAGPAGKPPSVHPAAAVLVLPPRRRAFPASHWPWRPAACCTLQWSSPAPYDAHAEARCVRRSALANSMTATVDCTMTLLQHDTTRAGGSSAAIAGPAARSRRRRRADLYLDWDWGRGSSYLGSDGA